MPWFAKVIIFGIVGILIYIWLGPDNVTEIGKGLGERAEDLATARSMTRTPPDCYSTQHTVTLRTSDWVSYPEIPECDWSISRGGGPSVAQVRINGDITTTRDWPLDGNIHYGDVIVTSMDFRLKPGETRPLTIIVGWEKK